MGTAAVVAGGASLVGGLLQGSAARSAARTQARASKRAQQTTLEYAEQTKSEILDRMIPALSDYRAGIQEAQDQIASGTFDVMRTLRQYSGNADQILQSAGIDAQKAIMGSSAMASGMPMSQFNQQYTAAQNSPPSARNAMMSNLSSASGMTPQEASSAGVQVAQPAGTQPVAVSGTGGLAPTATGGIAGGVPQTLQQAATQPAASGRQQAATQAAQAGTLGGAVGGTGTGFTGAVQDIQQGYGTAQRALDVSTAQARSDVTGSTSSALQQLAETRQAGLGQYQPYTEAGQAAIAKEAALSGAMGAEAQQQAIDAYIESPGQKYLREQQEKALLRNQAAIGGLGGGNIRSALQEQAMNIASTQQQQYLENLRSLATRGQEAAGATSDIIGQTGMYGAQLTAGAGNTLAQLQQQYGLSSANLAQMSSSELANLAQQTGINISSLQQATAAARAGLQTSLGSSLASAQAGATTDIANLISQGATTGLSAEQGVSSTLANLATGTGANLANLQLGQGSALAAGQYLQGQALSEGLQGLGNIAMFSEYMNQNPSSTGLVAGATQTTPIGNTVSYSPYGQYWSTGY